jgi:hypothetical protein
MSQRLALDVNLLGYWGLDEALETDAAIDTTANALDLTVTSSNGTAPGRVGNSRRFDGAATFASVTSAALRLTGDLTLMGWVKLNSYNSGGTQLRCLVSCAGPTSGDNQLYSLSVTLSGALTYRHTSASGPVVVSTAASVIRTGQFYFVVVRRVANGPNQDVEIFVDNVQKNPAVITVNGVSQALPVPPPLANASAVFSLGRSQKETNSAFWDGFLDEISVHDVARAYHSYLIDSYFRGALRAATTKLTVTNTVVAVSSYEMGAGVRWWCLERDKDLYVVKESPFGNFGPEIRLTTVGGGNSSLAGSPELVYDAPSDTLYVFFVSGNRVFKLTATSTDDPATINMPYTADTGSILKSLDNVDGSRVSDGGALREVLQSDFSQNTFAPVKVNAQDLGAYNVGDGGAIQEAVVAQGSPDTPQIALSSVPSLGFGLLVGPVNSQMSGYIVYRLEGGVPVALSAPTLLPTGVYFLALTRVYGRGYFAEALNPDGARTGIYSDVLVDRFGEVRTGPTGVVLSFGLDGDSFDPQGGTVGDGGGVREVLETEFTYVNRTPLKMSLQDADLNPVSDGGAQAGSVTNGTTNRPVDSGKVVQTQ